MSQGVDISFVHDADLPLEGDIVCRVETLDRALSGMRAKFSLIAEVEVQDSRPVNDKEALHSEEFVLQSIPREIRIPRESVRAYTYVGHSIHVQLKTVVVVDDSILFDSKISEDVELLLGLKPHIGSNSKAIVEPKDAFNFFKNLRAIPPQAMAMTFLLLIVGAVVVVVNMLIGIHDQFSPDSAVWIYSHSSSDDDSMPPLAAALMGSGGAGALVWFLIRKQLRRYMRFSLRKLPTLRPDRAYTVRDLVRGRSHVPLRDVTLRIVACNMEKGQYRRGSGTDERTVSFEEPVRAVILYEKHVELIGSREPVAPHFDGPVDFGLMFSALYPPIEVTKSHGLAVHWEVQLLHPEYVDQELVGPSDRFRYEHFLPA